MGTLDDPLHDREAGSRDSTLDTTRIDDVRIGAVRPLITPALLQERVPVRDEVLALVEGSRAAAAAILHGRDDRLLVVVGPCSIHDHDQAIDYGRRLKQVSDELKRRAAVVMRAYFEKPGPPSDGRATSTIPGSMAASPSTRAGASASAAARADHARAARRDRVPRPAQPAVPRRARRLGSDRRAHDREPSHRQLASGLSCPVGFKNGTEGSVRVARTRFSPRGRRMPSWA
jgi:3-deoxy-7-phosphoheptulonate synthase